MAIGFNSIPADLKIPLFWAEFTSRAANPGLGTKRCLLIGQQTLTAASVPTYTGLADQAATLFGPGSHLAQMARVFRANNNFGELWCLPIADAGGSTAATWALVYTGTATAAGTHFLYIGGELLPVGVTVGMTAAQLATAVAAAVNANTFLPVTAGVVTATVTLTARNKGTLSNDLDVRVNYLGTRGGEVTPAGLTVAITPTAGATDPTLAGLDAILGDEEYEVIVWPGTTTVQLDALSVLMNDTAGRWSYVRQVYGHVYSAKKGSAASLLTFGAGRNDQHVTVVGYPTGSPTPTWSHAAAWGAQVLASVSADPARPLQTLPLVGIKAPPPGGAYLVTERQSLLSTGIALESYNADLSASVLRSVTTYLLNSWGVTDRSYLDSETLHTLAEVIRRLRAAMTTKFARSKLVNDGTAFGAGQPIVTPKSVRAELIAQYMSMEEDGLVENAEAFAAATLVQRNANDPSRLDILYAPDLANGLRILAVLTEFRS